MSTTAPSQTAGAPQSTATLRYSVVVPVFNEHEIIAEFCAKAVAHLPPNYELLICYDLDEDTTLPALAALAPSQKPRTIRLIKNDLGKGVRYAIDAGMRAAQAPVVVVMMADVSDDFPKVSEMVSRCEAGADVVCASRYMKGGRQIGGPKLKGFLSRMAGLTLYWFTGLPTHDPTNSFKAYRKDFLQRTPIESTAGFTLSLELTAKAHFDGGRVEEVPATWLDRTAGESRFQLKKWLPLYLRWYAWAFGRRWLGGSPSELAWTGIWLLLFAMAFSLFAPLGQALPDSDVDASWQMVLPWAWTHGLQFGRDIIFSYGPWGFVLQGYDPATFGYTLAAWLLFTLAFAIASARIADRLISPRRPRPWWVGAVWFGILVALLGTGIPGMSSTRIFLLSAALLILQFHLPDQPETLSKALLVLAMALASLAEPSIGLLALVVVILTSIDQLLRRSIPWILVEFVGATGLLWLAAGQHPGTFPRFVGNSLELAAGYSQGMSFNQPTEIRDVTLYWVLATLLFVLVSILEFVQIVRARQQDALNPPTYDGYVSHHHERNAVARAFLALIGLVFALWLNFKLGYVRHEGNAEICSLTTLLALTLLYCAAHWQTVWPWTIRSLCVGLILFMAISLWVSQEHWTDRGLPTYLARELVQVPRQAARAIGWTFGGKSLRNEYEASLEETRQTVREPHPPGSVDAYPFFQKLVFANRLQYHPRPVIQSFAAYTPRLLRMNADFLRIPAAPDSIFFDVAPIDSHFPSLEDSASWLQVLTQYDLKDVRTSPLLYTRSAQPRNYSLQELQRTTGQRDTWIAVPQPPAPAPAQLTTQPATQPQAPMEAIWASIDLRPTATGSAIGMLYKPDPVLLQIRMFNGRLAQFRLIPDIARAGFLLSPYVGERLGFALLGSNEWRDFLRDGAITHIMITGGPDASFSAFYEQNFTVTFSQLQFPRANLDLVPGVAEYKRFHEMISHANVVPAERSLQIVGTDQSPAVLLIPGAEATGLLLPAAPSEAKALYLRFGMIWQKSGLLQNSQPVEFSAYGMNTDEQKGLTGNAFWHVRLDPSHVPGDRGLHEVMIPIPTPAPARILLQTAPAAGGESGLPYWADIDWR